MDGASGGGCIQQESAAPRGLASIGEGAQSRAPADPTAGMDTGNDDDGPAAGGAGRNGGGVAQS